MAIFTLGYLGYRELAKAGVQAYDEISGAKSAREEEAAVLKKMDEEQKSKIAADNQRIADEEKRRQRADEAKADAARMSQESTRRKAIGQTDPAKTGRKSTILTGPLGVTQSPYQSNKRTILGG